MFDRIKKFVTGEWGQRIGWTLLASAMVVGALFASANLAAYFVATLAVLGVTAMFAKMDDVRLPGWRRPLAGWVGLAVAGAMVFSVCTGLEAANRIIMLVVAIATLVYGGNKTADYLWNEVNKELKDD